MMSHVFISYKREDSDLLQSAFKVLDDARLDYEWDRGVLEVGQPNWFDEIDRNLELAFAVIVIVTEKSLDSPHVTYEWSWAVGHGIEVIPLQFGEIRENQKTHPLMRTNMEDCRQGISDKVIEKLKRCQEESPLVRYINLRINDITMPLRILAGFSLWLYPFERSNQVNFDTLHLLIEKASQEAERLYHETLPNFWLSSAHAFSVKHRRLYKELDEQIHDFGLLLTKLATTILNSNGLYDLSKEIAEVDKYRAEVMEPLFSHFRVSDWRLESVIAFSSILQDISANTLEDRDNFYKLTFPMMAQRLLSNFLADQDANTIWEIIKRLGGKNLFFD